METKVEKQYRCKGCGRLLAIGKIKGKLAIVCPRCGVYNNLAETIKTK